MKILANAITNRVAGSLTVGINFVRSYREGGFEHDLVVYAPAGCGYEELAGDRVTIRIAPKLVHAGWARIWVDRVWLPRVLAREKPDVLFAMGSIAYPTRTPQVVLYHWPYAAHPEREVWERMGLRDALNRRFRRWLFARRARHATRFAAQTETARGRLERFFGLHNVEVVPNAVSMPADRTDAPAAVLPEGARAPGRRALLCLSRYYPHKNLEILLPLARRIRETGAPFVVWLSVSRDEDPAAARLLDAIAREGLGDVLINLGTVPMDQVPALYEASSGLLLPTLLESFSGTYVESMYFGRPVFTSDRDFARDVCGNVAWYFDPHDAGDILAILEQAFADPAEREARVEAGRRRCKGFPGWPEVAARYVRLFEQVALGG